MLTASPAAAISIQDKKLLNDIAVVIICNSHIDDLGR